MTKEKAPTSNKKAKKAHSSPLNSSWTADKSDKGGKTGTKSAKKKRHDRHDDRDRQGKKGKGRNKEGRDDKHNQHNQHNRFQRGMSDSKKEEEAALTSLLFGGVAGGGVADTFDNYDSFGGSGGSAIVSGSDGDEGYGGEDAFSSGIDEKKVREGGEESDKEVEADSNSNWQGALFSIDRSGAEDDDDDDEDDGKGHGEGDGGGIDVDEDEDNEENEGARGLQNEEDDDEESGDESMEEYEEYNDPRTSFRTQAAWHDDEDSDGDGDTNNNNDNNSKRISLVEGPNRLKKLRRYQEETHPISLTEYELRLRERFVNTASVAARTDWADVSKVQEVQKGHQKEDGRKKKHYGSSEEESSEEEDEYGEYGEYDSAATKLLQSNESLFATSSSTSSTSPSRLPLPPTLLNMVRQRDANLTDPNKSAVNAVQFHPTCSDDGGPLLMTAGMDKMLRFFRVDGEDNAKVHGIHFPQLPIKCAAFLGDTGSVVVSGRRPFFYVYDSVSGNVEKIPNIMGRSERSLEKFSVSPNGRLIAFVGNDGYIILVDGKSRQWIGDLKMNGSVRAITFTPDSENVIASGSDGDVYRWNIRSKRCIERFHNQDGTITSSLACSSQRLAVGAESGVVNLYHHQSSSTPSYSRSSLATTEQTPIKSIMNLTCSADSLKFNGDGQILAMSTQREMDGLKLLHVPTATVFSNWPTSKTPLKYVWSMDFSPGSRYFAVGNDHGKCLLYRMNHFWEE